MLLPTYQKVFTRHTTGSSPKVAISKKAKRLLHIVVAAARPLTLKEMALASTIRKKHRSYNNLDLGSESRFRETIRDVCGLL